MIVRMPYTRRERRDGTFSERSTMKWRHVLKSLTVVMRSHGRKLKDVYALDGMGPAAETESIKRRWEVERIRLEAAFGGDASALPAFWLYELTEDGFRLVRSAQAVTP